MREAGVRLGQTQVCQQPNVGHAEPLAHQLAFVTLFARVRVDEHLVGARACSDAAQEVIASGEQKAWRVRVAQTPIFASVPVSGEAGAGAARGHGSYRDAYTR